MIHQLHKANGRANGWTGDAESHNQFHIFSETLCLHFHLHSAQPLIPWAWNDQRAVFPWYRWWRLLIRSEHRRLHTELGRARSPGECAPFPAARTRSAAVWLPLNDSSTLLPVIATPQQLLVAWYEQQKRMKQITLKECNVLYLK